MEQDKMLEENVQQEELVEKELPPVDFNAFTTSCFHSS